MKKRIRCLLLVLMFCLVLCVGAAAAEQTGAQLSYVTDAAGLLSENENMLLEKMAESVSKKYGVGVYIVTVEDYRDFHSEGVYKATYTIYHECTMGAILSRHNGKALLSRVRPLIILPRQELHAQHQVPLRKSCLCIIHRRFGEHRSHCLLIILIREAVHIVTMVNGGIRNPIPQHLPKLASQTFLPLAEPFLLSYIQTSDIRQVQHSFP